MTNNKRDEFDTYGDIWNYNLQSIDELHKEIEKSVEELNSQYELFEGMYQSIKSKVDILATIYSTYNILEGQDQVLKLKAILDTYRKRYTREEMDFELIFYVMGKIKELRNTSFSDFPHLIHEDEDFQVEEEEKPAINYASYQHKWITFQQHKSWFITPYHSYRFLKKNDFSFTKGNMPDDISIKTDKDTFRAINIFSRNEIDPESIRYAVLLNGGSKNFVVTKIGRRIHARSDIISPLIHPFEKKIETSISPGRLKIFGENHIYIN